MVTRFSRRVMRSDTWFFLSAGTGALFLCALYWALNGHSIEFVTLHHMAVLDMKSDKVTKGDADYKEGWACFMVRPREADFVRSDLLRDEYGNTMLACFWKEPL